MRHYTEETSASVTLPENARQPTDISSLMAGSTSSSQGQGGSEADTQNLSPRQDNFVQAVDSVSKDYLEDMKPNRVVEYTVQPGDALSFIASDFGVSVASIIWANKLTNINSISPGKILRIPPVSGIIHTVQRGETATSIAKKYHADPEKIISFNDLGTSDNLNPGTDLIVPDGTPSPSLNTSLNIHVKAGFLSSVTSVAKKFAYLPDLASYFEVPATGFNWGIVHDRNGVDIANDCGTPIEAAADGNVAIALSFGWNGGFGKYIKLVHANGTETLYAHLSKLLISEGQTVSQGQQIALMGTTGHSTGCHLHFEVHGARNPLAKY